MCKKYKTRKKDKTYKNGKACKKDKTCKKDKPLLPFRGDGREVKRKKPCVDHPCIPHADWPKRKKSSGGLLFRRTSS